jgi:hypothetical protein
VNASKARVPDFDLSTTSSRFRYSRRTEFDARKQTGKNHNGASIGVLKPWLFLLFIILPILFETGSN